MNFDVPNRKDVVNSNYGGENSSYALATTSTRQGTEPDFAVKTENSRPGPLTRSESVGDQKEEEHGEGPSEGQKGLIDDGRNEDKEISLTKGVTMKGVVKHWNFEKGFGFIEREDGEPDVFVHQSVIQCDPPGGFRALREGQAVEYEIIPGKDGKVKAYNVTGPNGVRIPPPPRRMYPDPRASNAYGWAGYGYGGYGMYGEYGWPTQYDQNYIAALYSTLWKSCSNFTKFSSLVEKYGYYNGYQYQYGNYMSAYAIEPESKSTSSYSPY